ncbi:MAG: aldo/keto reductase [Chloroflexota bacterium]
MIDSPNEERVELGPGGIFVKPLGIGTWAWGDRVLWDYGKGGFSDDDLKAAFDASLAAGVTLFDTAEVYGSGQSERLLGKFIGGTDQMVMVASKFMPYPWRLRGKSLLNALRNSLERMGLEKLDLYQIHWPFPLVSIERWMEAMAQAVEEELIGDVGVSNFSVEQTIRAHKALEQYDIPLVSNQVEYSLANRKVERDGLLQVCEELKVKVIAASPLAQGLLTGKYRVGKAPGGLRGIRAGRNMMEQTDRLIAALKKMGDKYIGKTPAQVALNWAIQKGTIPIPGVKNLRQAKETLGALGWQLYDVDVAELDGLGM